LSDDHLKAIIWVMRECGTPDVPSFYALRKKQAELACQLVSTKCHVSSLGNQFYMNSPASLFAMDWANPRVRPFIHPYVDITGPVSEAWQAGKALKHIDDTLLSPMWADWKLAGHRHFYIQELAQLDDGRYVIPKRWVTKSNAEYAEVYQAQIMEDGRFGLYDPDTQLVRCQRLKANYPDLIALHGEIAFTAPAWAHTMPNAIRKIANNCPAFTLLAMVWSDDVSGNVSKQYNPHTNVYLANASLPHTKLSQEYFIHFCSTSPHASSSEQLDAMQQQIDSPARHVAYDCELMQEVIFRIMTHVLPADNPQQSETCSHIGVNANFNSRVDTTGGTKAEKETDAGYEKLFYPGILRTPQDTINTIQEQLWAACLGVQSTVDALQTATGVKDKIAQHWIGVLIHQARQLQRERLHDTDTMDVRLRSKSLKGDARREVRAQIVCDIQQELYDWLVLQPPERYHALPIGSVLLGTDKYLWHATSNTWDKQKDKTFAIRLQSSSMDGLTIPSIRAYYIAQYKNSLIGKHFKTLQQLGSFHLHGNLCPDTVFKLWLANCELGALIWYTEIRNMSLYIADLTILIANVLDYWAELDPSRIVNKIKLRILTYLVPNVQRHGPAILYHTEVFECWNSIFRLCSVLSNHHAPSHDIAATTADMERFKHQASGGFWKNDQGDWIQAGKKIRDLFQENRALQGRLGWNDTAEVSPGHVGLLPQSLRDISTWAQALGAHFSQLSEPTGKTGLNWVKSKYITAQSSDRCHEGSWVFAAQTEVNYIPYTLSVTDGRIALILTASSSLNRPQDDTVIILELFIIFSDANHQRMNMPLLSRPTTAGTPTAAVLTPQHDCSGNGCRVGTTPARQERAETSRSVDQVIHTGDDHYFLNLHALHNASRIREVLPRHLTAPQCAFPDRQQHH
ncbi:hypothetical protein PUNSTDRAFT_36762, partial [Punctularia strigosozonata HHB-11173 SS5]|uniref:uncharacterized protein n=1 Tax=Punctularia strigosozonata (strain HHB-11173) TaxID=741275 RepID=UPI00044184A7